MRLHTVTRACSNMHCTPYTTQNVLLHFCGTLTMVQWCPLVYLLMFREATSFKMGQSYGWLSSNELTLTDWGDTDCFQPQQNTKRPKPCSYCVECAFLSYVLSMMTSSIGNIFRVTGHLCGEYTSPRWIPPHKGQWRGALMFSLICVWINRWVNNR